MAFTGQTHICDLQCTVFINQDVSLHVDKMSTNKNSIHTQCLPTKVCTHNVSLQKYIHTMSPYKSMYTQYIRTYNVSLQKYVHTMSPHKSMYTQCLPTKVCAHNVSLQKYVHTMPPHKRMYIQCLLTKVRTHKVSLQKCGLPTYTDMYIELCGITNYQFQYVSPHSITV